MRKLLGRIFVLQVDDFGLVLQDPTLCMTIDVFQHVKLRLVFLVLVDRHERGTDPLVVYLIILTVEGVSIRSVESFVYASVACFLLNAT